MTDSRKIATTESLSNGKSSPTERLMNKGTDNEDVAGLGSISSRTINPKAAQIDTTKREQQSLHPFVHWAQSQTHISLRVDLIQVENLDVTLADTGTKLDFFAQGRGAHGLQDYRFSLELYSSVDKKIDCHSIERYVLILIKKIDQQVNWPRLTKQQSKFPWLRVDFDRYHADDSDDSLDNDEANNIAQSKQSYDLLRQQLDEARHQQLEHTDLDKWTSGNSWFGSLSEIFRRNTFNNLNPFSKQTDCNKMKHDYRKEAAPTGSSKNIAKHALDAKKTYLFLYNLIMFIMFLKVYIVLLIKGLSGNVDDDIVQGAAFIIKVLTYTQLLESIHPMLGLVPGGPLMPFTQVIGRLLVNHFLSEPEIRLDSAPYAHYLFVVWSSIEIFRYTLFLPLYPMGGLCESMVIFSTIKFYEKTGDYSIALPNAANISFSPSVALRIYTFLLLGPTIYSLMKYMWRQRCKQLKKKVA